MYKKLGLLTLVVFALSACDVPRPARMRLGESTSELQTEGFSAEDTKESGNSSSDSSSDSENTNSTNTGSSLVIPDDAAHCNWSQDGSTGFSYSDSLIGEYTLCKGQLNTNTAYFQIKTPITSGEKLCFIPVTTVPNTTKKTTYLGNPHCDYFPKNTTLYRLNFTLSRSPYGLDTITGFIILRDGYGTYPSPFPYWVQYGQLYPQNGGTIRHYMAYYGCMDALEIYQTNKYCDAFLSVGQFINHFPLK